MYEFSVEQAANKIHDHRSKEYFGEVLNNYFNGNYRSSVVMLWTVVICDLVYKLQYLKDIHNDEKATTILDEMVEFQAKNPANPKWEETLLKEISSRTNLLESHELDSLLVLQKHRHLSAHPVINKADILFRPHREMVLSDIRIALDSVLTKPPILTKQVFTELVLDLERIKDLFAEASQLSRYLESKYFSNLNREISAQLFKSLWRIAFKTDNEKCNENREINVRALRILFERDREFFAGCVRDSSAYYSEIGDNSPLRHAIFFLGDYPHLFNLLTEAAREFIKAKSQTDIDLLTVSYFLSSNISEHIDMLVKHINQYHKLAFGGAHNIHRNHINDLRQHASSAGIKNDINKLLVTMYVNSLNFDAADVLFAQFIKPFIENFSAEDVELLIIGIGENNQTHWRGRANEDHKAVVAKASELIKDFDPSKFSYLPKIAK
ncbi:hypothetical protein [Pseudomonas aeruginosa]|uniref:hypothetical protein n=2 Tax=Pseudomonas aeruginosa TaxID=287 RepID=UPI00050E343B|nr:hypothetical protein [Pseudomonas aeruginosa]EMC9464671.1 hypothetical protein [Pseudomonas aeruginosa]KGB86027.1 hypothetical protein JF43_18925 [Pseudomonas aeruginosa]MBA4915681.1 hypothetical protein [Pseudomonas aeruginosa]MBG4894059.1 hypothetical protein [Pseudomonas aeruginosa]MBG6308804.1 hypothetical protein [Pseudomonas aeruginosa]